MAARIFPMLMRFGLIIFLSQIGVGAWAATEAADAARRDPEAARNVTQTAGWLQGHALRRRRRHAHRHRPGAVHDHHRQDLHGQSHPRDRPGSHRSRVPSVCLHAPGSGAPSAAPRSAPQTGRPAACATIRPTQPGLERALGGGHAGLLHGHVPPHRLPRNGRRRAARRRPRLGPHVHLGVPHRHAHHRHVPRRPHAAPGHRQRRRTHLLPPSPDHRPGRHHHQRRLRRPLHPRPRPRPPAAQPRDARRLRQTPRRHARVRTHPARPHLRRQRLPRTCPCKPTRASPWASSGPSTACPSPSPPSDPR